LPPRRAGDTFSRERSGANARRERIVTRSPEDQDAWVLREAGASGLPSAFETIHHLLLRLPDRHRGALGVFGAVPDGALVLLAARYERVVGRTCCRPAELRRLAVRLDAAIAHDLFRGATRAAVDGTLAALHDSLVEGGLLFATFPALASRGRPYALWPRAELPEGGPYHEIEVQYRVRRAGFRGLRLWRVAEPGSAPRLLALAARRACN